MRPQAMFKNLFSWLLVNTVDDVLAVFSKAVVKLEALSEKYHEQADALQAQAAEVKAQADKARAEALRAAKSAGKIKDLLQ